MNIGNWIADHHSFFQVLSYGFGGLAVYSLIVAFVLHRLILRHEDREAAARGRIEQSFRAARSVSTPRETAPVPSFTGAVQFQ